MSHPEICNGDHHNASLSSTTARNRGFIVSFDGFGRWARRRDARCATAARYRRRPPLAATSRDTVDGERPNRRAIHRNDWPPASPREISSRSLNDNRNRHQSAAGTGRRHPAATTWVRTDDGARPNARLIARSDSPASNLSHNSAFSDSENRPTTSPPRRDNNNSRRK
jgi:hypothetical protein